MPAFHALLLSLSKCFSRGLLHHCRGGFATSIALMSLAAGHPSPAGDWPQILGPNRNGIAADDERLARKWPSGGPPVVWEKEVGAGYAGVAVVGPQAFLFHRRGGQDILEALDATTGDTLWAKESPTQFAPSVGSGDGPLCVPTVIGDTVITYSAQGALRAWDAASGALRWERETHQEFGAQEGYFGAGSTPLVVDDVVIVNVGGNKSDSGIVGFDLRSGETRWKTTSEPASYSAPILVQLSAGGDPVPAAIVITRYKCIALNPASGDVYWEFPFGKRGPTVNGSAPVMFDESLFVTASYGIGARFGEVTRSGFHQAWDSDSILSTQYATPVAHKGVLFGIQGRDDLPPADLRCIDPKAEKVLWNEPDFGYGTLLMADGMLIIAKTDGTLVLADADPTQFRQRSRARAFNGTIRALPALSNGGLYVRDDTRLRRLNVAPQE